MAKPTAGNAIKLRDSSSGELQKLQNEQRKHQKVRNSNRIILIAAVILFLSYAYSIVLFILPEAGNFNLAVLLSSMQNQMKAFFAWLGGNNPGTYTPTVIRYTIIVLTGASLAAAGTVFQGSFRNIIASPTTMGVQAGASLGNALYTFFFVSVVTETLVLDTDLEAAKRLSVWQLNLQQLFAVLGALIAVVIVISLTNLFGKGGMSGGTILFSGMLFSSFAGAITTIFQYYFMYRDPDDSRWRSLQEFGLGNYSRVSTPQHLVLMSVFLIPALAILLWLSPKLNVLVMGEDEARTMGINVKQIRNTLITVGTIMSAIVFAFCGGIGFVGFIVPQICRPLVGPDFRKLLPMTMIVGAILMIWVYNLAFAIGLTLYMNMITSILGSVMMIWSFAHGKGGRSYA